MIHQTITRTMDEVMLPEGIKKAETPLKILVVDDSLILRRSLSGMIHTLGHEVAGEAKNGNEAITQYTQLKPDIVTMDITMPDMDGITAVKEIRYKHPEAIIIMITSHGQEEMVIDAIKAGAKGYLLKPIDVQKLYDSISKALRKDTKSSNPSPSTCIVHDNLYDIHIPDL